MVRVVLSKEEINVLKRNGYSELEIENIKDELTTVAQEQYYEYSYYPKKDPFNLFPTDNWKKFR